MSDPDWRERHSRHLLIPGMDGQRQQQLMNSSVGIFGRSPMAEPLLDTLARGGIGHLGIATDEALESAAAWLEQVQRRIHSGNHHTHLHPAASIRDRDALESWAEPWDWVVDTSGSKETSRILGHFCLERGKFFQSCRMDHGYGWVLSIPPTPRPTPVCPATMPDPGVESQTLPPPLDHLLPPLIAFTAAGEILSRMTRLLRNDDIFLLRIDAKKGHYCRVQPTADPACIRCAAQETLAPTLIQPGNSASRSGEAFIDITGEACPMTFVRVKLKLEPLPAGTLLKVRLSGTEAVTNVPLSLRHAGHEVVSLAQCEGVYELLVKKCDTKLREE